MKSLQKQKSHTYGGQDLVEDLEDVLHAEILPPDSGLPKAVPRELPRARTRVLRLLLARDREAALAVTVASMLMRVRFTRETPDASVAAYPARVEDLAALAETRSALLAHVPDDVDKIQRWCLDQPTGTVLAVLVASTVDVIHEKGSPCDRLRQTVADELAVALDLDMRACWRADAAYWTRLPRAELLVARADAPGCLKCWQLHANMTCRAVLSSSEMSLRPK